MGRHKAKRPVKKPPSVKKLASKCSCGKLGYSEEHVAMQAVISGSFTRAGVRAYQCEKTGLWHTTSMRTVPPHARTKLEDVPVPEGASPVDGLLDQERALIHAVRRVRVLRRRRGLNKGSVTGDEIMLASNTAQKALSIAINAQDH